MAFARTQVKTGVFSVNRICRLCGLSKNTYYNHKHPDERFADKFKHLKIRIKRIIAKNGAYGVKRIKQELLDRHRVEIGRDALSRLLKLWRLGLCRRPHASKKSVIKEILAGLADRTNLLVRTTITEPFQAVTSDMTEIIYDHGRSRACLAVHKDVLGQMVYGFATGETMEAKLVVDSLKRAVSAIRRLIERMPTELLCHSDQGSQYTSYEYVETALKNKMVLSYSTPGTPTENPGQESFFGRLKDECRDEFAEMRNFEALKKLISKKISYYNNQRLHTSLKLQSPKKYTLKFINNFPK